MVNVDEKEISRREAVAESIVSLSPETLRIVTEGTVPKGNVFTTAKIAGIMAAKQTSSLIPLTHPLALSHVEIELSAVAEESSIRIVATVRCEGKTGVEIEAMTAASIAALTIYDMCKALDRKIEIRSTRLLSKSGGKSGDFRAD